MQCSRKYGGQKEVQIVKCVSFSFPGCLSFHCPMQLARVPCISQGSDSYVLFWLNNSQHTTPACSVQGLDESLLEMQSRSVCSLPVQSNPPVPFPSFCPKHDSLQGMAENPEAIFSQPLLHVYITMWRTCCFI